MFRLNPSYFPSHYNKKISTILQGNIDLMFDTIKFATIMVMIYLKLNNNKTKI